MAEIIDLKKTESKLFTTNLPCCFVLYSGLWSITQIPSAAYCYSPAYKTLIGSVKWTLNRVGCSSTRHHRSLHLRPSLKSGQLASGAGTRQIQHHAEVPLFTKCERITSHNVVLTILQLFDNIIIFVILLVYYGPYFYFV